MHRFYRRVAGAVERDGLENRYARKSIEGSNPSLSVEFGLAGKR